jgi:hypothetical protein
MNIVDLLLFIIGLATVWYVDGNTRMNPSRSLMPHTPSSVRGLVVMIVACQVMDPGSIPGGRSVAFSSNLHSNEMNYRGIGFRQRPNTEARVGK